MQTLTRYVSLRERGGVPVHGFDFLRLTLATLTAHGRCSLPSAGATPARVAECLDCGLVFVCARPGDVCACKRCGTAGAVAPFSSAA